MSYKQPHPLNKIRCVVCVKGYDASSNASTRVFIPVCNAAVHTEIVLAFIFTLNIFELKWEISGGGDPGKIRGRGTGGGRRKREEV